MNGALSVCDGTSPGARTARSFVSPARVNASRAGVICTTGAGVVPVHAV